jgi:hypothetical protein
VWELPGGGGAAAAAAAAAAVGVGGGNSARNVSDVGDLATGAANDKEEDREEDEREGQEEEEGEEEQEGYAEAGHEAEAAEVGRSVDSSIGGQGQWPYERTGVGGGGRSLLVGRSGRDDRRQRGSTPTSGAHSTGYYGTACRQLSSYCPLCLVTYQNTHSSFGQVTKLRIN